MSPNPFSWPALALAPAAVFAGLPSPNGVTSTSINPEVEFSALYSLAEKNLKNNQPAAALKIFTDLEKKFSDTPTKVRALFLLQRANCHFQQRDWKNAVLTLKEFNEKFPKGTEDLLGASDNKITASQFTLAEAYRQLGQWDCALETLNRLAGSPLILIKDRSSACRLAASLIQERSQAGTEAEKSQADKQAIELLKKAVSVGLNTPEGKLAGAALIEAYIREQMLPAAQALQTALESAQSNSPTDTIRAHQQRQTQGDAYFTEAGQTPEGPQKNLLLRQALQSYQAILPHHSLLTQIQKNIAAVKESVAELTRLSPKPSPQIAEKMNGYQAQLKEWVAAEMAMQHYPVSDQSIYYRIGLCLHELHMPLEANVAFQEILNTHPLFPQASTAAYCIILNLLELGKNQEAQNACRTFIERYPEAKEIGHVSILVGSIAQDRHDYRDALAQYQWVKTKVKKLKPEVAQEIDYRCCFAIFSLNEWAKAQDAWSQFIKKHPQSIALEQAIYLKALTAFYQRQTEAAEKSFFDYQTKYPAGSFLPDVLYRLALMDYGKTPPQFENALQACQRWIKKYAHQTEREIKIKAADVYTLMGDSEAGLSTTLETKLTPLRQSSDPRVDSLVSSLEIQKAVHDQRSIDAYLLATKNGQHNPEALHYSLQKLQPALKRQKKFSALRNLYLDLYQTNKQSPQASNYLLEAVLATERLDDLSAENKATGQPSGNLPSAQTRALSLLSQAIKDTLEDPQQEGTEKLLTLLAERVFKKYAHLPEGFTQGQHEIASLLMTPKNPPVAIATARLFFTQAQLASLQRQPHQANQLFQSIADKFSAGELSAPLLALTSENLLGRGQLLKAEIFLNELIQNHRTSTYADYGFAGLAALRLEQKNPSAALELCNEALKYPFTQNKECQLRLVRGQALTELRQYTAAKKEFEAVAQTKAWRGDSTACSLYWLGLIEERQGHTAEAVAYYRRCYQGWKKYPQWSAKAYWGTAQLLAKQLQQPQEATTLIHEMLSHDFIKDTPEAHRAQNLLSAL